MTANSQVNVLELGLACCAVEASTVDLVKQSASGFDSEQMAVLGTNVLIVAGTVTRALSETVRSNYEKLSEPKVVVAFGACAISGGPYWDSYSVIPGADSLIPVDIYVPGCPPAPEDLAGALSQAIERVRK